MPTTKSKQRASIGVTILLAYVFVASLSVWAQAPSSRQIPFSGVPTTISPSTPAQTLTLRVLDNSNPPVALYCETQTLDVNENGAISFNLGAGAAVNPPCPSAPPGLNPADFASGSTRSLDVVDTNGNSVLANPIPLTAVAFALSPGPTGPAGPKGDKGDTGPQGQQGPPGVVQAITPSDGSIVVGGSAVNPTIAVAANGITNSNIADGSISRAKIAGVAATLGPNLFFGDQSTNGNLSATGNLGLGDSSATAGNIFKGGAPFIHNFGTANTFVGKNAGNLTTSGSGRNTAVGVSALQNNTAGAFNTANGFGSLFSNDIGSFNTSLGENSLLFNTSGSSNTGTGLAALYRNTTGSNNTALGYGAGLTATAANANTTGSNNTFIGYLAGPGTPTQLTNATAIGANALVSASNALVLGGTGTNAVNVGIGTATPASTLDVNGTANFAGGVTGSTFKGGVNLAVTDLTPQTTFRSGSVALYVIPASDSMLVARTDTFDTTYNSIRPLMLSAAANPGHILVCERKGTTLPFVLELRFGDLVNGSSTWPSVNNTLVLVSDGINNWIVIANF